MEKRSKKSGAVTSYAATGKQICVPIIQQRPALKVDKARLLKTRCSAVQQARRYPCMGNVLKVVAWGAVQARKCIFGAAL